jgi:hypothetical protein
VKNNQGLIIQDNLPVLFLFHLHQYLTHYNVMRFKEILSVDEAEVMTKRFSSVSGRHYVLHDPEKLAEKYTNA